MADQDERALPLELMVKVPTTVSTPESFNFADPSSWPKWRKRFERYMSIAGHVNKPDEEKNNLLLYLMGEESENILLQFDPKPETYVETLDCFEKHFIPRRNIIFERFKFNSCIQKPEEPVEKFITRLHKLAENCDFGALKDELIRDRIVVGMLDRKTSERLQLMEKLSLNDCIVTAKQAEIQAIQSREIHSAISTRSTTGTETDSRSQEDLAIAAIHRNSGRQQWQRGRGGMSMSTSSRGLTVRPNTPEDRQQRVVAEFPHPSATRGREVAENGRCRFCGLQPHARFRCPAKNATCRECNKIGHWAKVCLSTKVRSLELESNNEFGESKESNYLGLMSINSSLVKEWVVPIFVSFLGLKCNFLIDTGADVTCIPYSLVPQNLKEFIVPTSKIITGPAGFKLRVAGIVASKLSCDKNSFRLSPGEIHTEIFVIHNLGKPILGRTSISDLKIIQFDNSVSSESKVHNLNETQDIITITNITSTFPRLFNSVGTFKTEMTIRLRKGVQPYAQSTPRVVPIPLRKPLKEELNRLQKLGIIQAVDEYTPWVSPIVVVKKDSGVRLCVDYTHLNRAVLRSYFPIGKVESILAQISGSHYFSKLDTTSGFYQIKLDKGSQPLTCFITPFGRFIFKRLPFGISCAPEYFSMLLNKILAGIEGVISHIDDILIHASTREEHDKILFEVLKRIEQEGITLNKSKCCFGVKRLIYLGHLISERGISIDPERINTIKRFPEPKNRTEVMRFLGMVNFSARFLPRRSEILEPITSLLKKNSTFVWDVAQKNSFKQIIEHLQTGPCLSFFDPSKQISISADSSSFGLGACLIQSSSENNKEIVAYASRLLSETEKRYAQIEKEALALTWACDHFSEYITGLTVFLETDHKPLVQILQTKPLDELSPRLQRFRMRIMRYDYKVYYTPGKDLVVADALSRNFPEGSVIPHDNELSEETEAHVQFVVQSLPVKSYFLDEIKAEQSTDNICNLLKKYCQQGWPQKSKLSDELLPYYQYRFEISYLKDFLLKGARLIIPYTLQRKCLELIHQGHLGIVKCRAKAKTSVWWLGLSTQIENMIRNCPVCIENKSNNVEPFVKEKFPERAWQKIALDLFKLEKWYLIVTDYFSRFFEIFPLTSLTECVIIEKLKQLFSRYGIPETVRSDNGPQFQTDFKRFAATYDFQHITSSPHFPQSNGCVEAAVKIAKNLLKKNKKDMDLALLSYRSTPLECGYSPAELLMGRKLRTLLPILPDQLNSQVDFDTVIRRENMNREKSANWFNRRHRSKTLSDLDNNEVVWVTDLKEYAKVVKKLDVPRSYLIKSEVTGTEYRRNRWHLIPAPYRNIQDSNSPIRERVTLSNNAGVRDHADSDNDQTFSNTGRDLDLEHQVKSAPYMTDVVGNKNRSLSNRPIRQLHRPKYLQDFVTD